MEINILHQPPQNIPEERWKYTRLSLFFLSLIICSIIIGAIGLFMATGYDDILQNSSFISFVVFGFAFVYFAEKLLNYRRLGPKQQEELHAMRKEYKEVEEYCRKVTGQGRYLVVVEFDALVAYIDKIKEKKPAQKV